MLDPRLYPLLETLTRSGLDWLAQEAMSGALAGRVAEEAPDALAQARSVAFREFQDTRELKPAVVPRERAIPFEGDQQIIWAVGHIGIRIEQLLEMSLASVDRLDSLVDPDLKTFGRARTSMLATTDDEDLIQIGRSQLVAGIESLDDLHRVLNDWVLETLNEKQP